MKSKEVRDLYGSPAGRASIKVLPSLEYHSKNFIKNSPFLIMSSFDSLGKVDTSPRGGQPGFVHILDDNHLLIPDAKGNNRVDSITNIAETGRIGMLFLMPGIDETLRINGAAEISDERKHLDLFPNERHPPKTVIVVTVEEMFLHCAKALMRSKLWSIDSQITREDFPTMGRMLKDQLGGDKPLETQEEMVNRYSKDL